MGRIRGPMDAGGVGLKVISRWMKRWVGGRHGRQYEGVTA